MLKHENLMLSDCDMIVKNQVFYSFFVSLIAI